LCPPVHGRRHDGSPAGGVPTVFGMNFQAVSVGQKLAKDNADARCNNADGDRLRGKPGPWTPCASSTRPFLPA